MIKYSLEIVKPQPTVSELPVHIAAKKPKTKWFRDPTTYYWVQIQVKTGNYYNTSFQLNSNPRLNKNDIFEFLGFF